MRFRLIEQARSLAPSSYMEERPCPICGDVRLRPIMRYDGYQFYVDAVVPPRVDICHVMCEACFAVFMNPVFSKEGFAALFAGAGSSYGSTSERPGETIAWLDKHGLLADGTRMVDIGCYEGGFIGNLPPTVAALGIDIDAPAIDRARHKYRDMPNRRFLCSDFESASIGGGVDLITMIMVLEHLPYPVEVLRRLSSQAQPRTRLVVEVPVVEHMQRGVANGCLKWDVSGFLVTPHVTHFSVASLRNCLIQGGWKAIYAEAMAYGGFRVIAEPAERGTPALRPCAKDAVHFAAYLRDWRADIALAGIRLSALAAPRCVLRGGGLHTEYLYHLTSLFSGKREFLVVDNDPMKAGKTWRGIDIVASDSLSAIDWKSTQMVLSSYSHHDALRSEAEKMHVPADRVVTLYDTICRH
jgi:2-polyprenyl-3-methyl-5-hydroxy-6-metoxy-1,4-benzoquinol methylase